MPSTLTQTLIAQLRLPVFAAPMFIVSTPELVIAQCISGIVGSIPALNARPQSKLGTWLAQIEEGLERQRKQHPDQPPAPYAINHIIHQSNDRLIDDLAVCAEHKVPLIITSLRAPDDIVPQVHNWGGKVFHDVTTLRHAKRAIQAGVDGLILVAAGAGGHAGPLSPFALLAEVRAIFDGPIILSGAISRGADVLAAQAMGADFAYIGSHFIASIEANAADNYKKTLVSAEASDIVHTPYFTGIPGNYLRQSIIAAGLDPDNLPESQETAFGSADSDAKAWRDIWGAGQGVGSIRAIEPAQAICERLIAQYHRAFRELQDNYIPNRKGG